MERQNYKQCEKSVREKFCKSYSFAFSLTHTVYARHVHVQLHNKKVAGEKKAESLAKKEYHQRRQLSFVVQLVW